jgi:hypothetical protein
LSKRATDLARIIVAPKRLLLTKYEPIQSSLLRHGLLAANAYWGTMRILEEIPTAAKNGRPNMYGFLLFVHGIARGRHVYEVSWIVCV